MTNNKDWPKRGEKWLRETVLPELAVRQTGSWPLVVPNPQDCRDIELGTFSHETMFKIEHQNGARRYFVFRVTDKGDVYLEERTLEGEDADCKSYDAGEHVRTLWRGKSDSESRSGIGEQIDRLLKI